MTCFCLRRNFLGGKGTQKMWVLCVAICISREQLSNSPTIYWTGNEIWVIHLWPKTTFPLRSSHWDHCDSELNFPGFVRSLWSGRGCSPNFWYVLHVLCSYIFLPEGSPDLKTTYCSSHRYKDSFLWSHDSRLKLKSKPHYFTAFFVSRPEIRPTCCLDPVP